MSAILDELLKAKVQLAGAAAENADVLANLLRSRLDVRADGSVAVIDGNGNVRVGGGPSYGDMSLDEAVAELAAAKPTLFRKSELPPQSETPPVNENMTARAAREARERQATAPKTTGPESNPFTRRGWNVTMQVLMKHRDPDKASRLEQEAAALPAHLDKLYLDINHP